MREVNRRYLAHAELARSGHATVTGDDAEIAIEQHRIRPAELAQTRGQLRDLLIAVRAGVARVRHEPIDIAIHDGKLRRHGTLVAQYRVGKKPEHAHDHRARARGDRTPHMSDDYRGLTARCQSSDGSRETLMPQGPARRRATTRSTSFSRAPHAFARAACCRDDLRRPDASRSRSRRWASRGRSARIPKAAVLSRCLAVVTALAHRAPVALIPEQSFVAAMRDHVIDDGRGQQTPKRLALIALADGMSTQKRCACLAPLR